MRSTGGGDINLLHDRYILIFNGNILQKGFHLSNSIQGATKKQPLLITPIPEDVLQKVNNHINDLISKTEIENSVIKIIPLYNYKDTKTKLEINDEEKIANAKLYEQLKLEITKDENVSKNVIENFISKALSKKTFPEFWATFGYLLATTTHDDKIISILETVDNPMFAVELRKYMESTISAKFPLGFSQRRRYREHDFHFLFIEEFKDIVEKIVRLGDYISETYGYGNYGNYELAYDPDKSIMMFGLSAGYGKRLNWPDDYFQFMATLNYQLYMMKDWDYFLVNNGNCHNINLELNLQRNSIDNPLYTRKGSQFMFSVAATPPWSLWDGKDYKNMSDQDEAKFRMIEYHKWKFKAKIFSPLAPLTVKRTPVLMTRVEYGFLGSYNKYKKSPFETFYMGGDGMSGYSSTYATETIGLRGYENGSIAGNGGYNSYGYAYSRLSMELRYPFLLEPSSTIYGLVFVEAGNAWRDLKDFNPFQLKRSAGVGVRIFLPMIGLMGIDWAYGFDRPDGYDQRGGSNFHFIIGQEF